MILYYSESIEKYLFGGYIFREELHARMHIWAVIRFASNEPNGMEGFKWMVEGF